MHMSRWIGFAAVVAASMSGSFALQIPRTSTPRRWATATATVTLPLTLTETRWQTTALRANTNANTSPNSSSPESGGGGGSSLALVAGVYAVAPILPAIVLPFLTDAFRATQDPNDLLTVLASKRLFLYALATLATAYAGWRASTSNVQAGKSLDTLNREILQGELPGSSDDENDDDSNQEEKEKDALFAFIDEKPDGVGLQVALALPAVLAILLAVSYILVSPNTAIPDTNVVSVDIAAAFGSISTFANLAVCLLFTATEYRSWVTNENINKNTEEAQQQQQLIIIIANLVAAATVAAATLLPTSEAWPFQNSVNIALAVTVTRALAPFLSPSISIRTVALALTGLAAYDAFSVFGTAALVGAANAATIPILASSTTATTAAAAMTHSATTLVTTSSSVGHVAVTTSTITTAAASSSGSVMETVARAKLEGASAGAWRPGLLEMVLVGRVSDALGLGDIVFPACLVAWGWRVDIAYAKAAIAGYAIGSVATEVASTVGPLAGSGQPALIFIAPAMLASVTLTAVQRGEVKQVWGK